MKYQENKNNHNIILVYIVLGAIFVITVIFAVMMIRGYRWNVKESHIEAYGVIQVKTFPDGANVKINNKELGFLDGQRLDLAEGKHSVTVSKDGYRTWSDEVLIKGGKVKWLNVRLFPEKIDSSLVKSYSSLLNSYESTSGRYILNHLSKNNFELVDLTDNEPKYIDLPLEKFYLRADKFNFEFCEWNLASQSLLFRDSSSESLQTIMINYKEPKATVDLTERYEKEKIDFKKIKFTGGKGMILFALSGEKLYRMDLAAADTPAELIADNVLSFVTIDENKIAFVQKNLKDAQFPTQVVLYNYKNAQFVLFDRVVDGVMPAINVLRFNESDYLVYNLDKRIMIFKADNEFYNLKSAPENTSTADKTKVGLLYEKFLELNPKIKLIYSKFFDRDVKMIITGSPRFVTAVVQPKNIPSDVVNKSGTDLGVNVDLFVYDIENDESHQYLYYDALDLGSVELKWLDNVILWTKTNQGMRVRYYDGNNGYILSQVKPAFGVQFNGRESDLYYLVRGEDNKFDLIKTEIVQ